MNLSKLIMQDPWRQDFFFIFAFIFLKKSIICLIVIVFHWFQNLSVLHITKWTTVVNTLTYLIGI